MWWHGSVTNARAAVGVGLGRARLKEATGQDDDQDGDDDGGIRAHEIHGFVGAIGGDRGAGADGDAEEE